MAETLADQLTERSDATLRNSDITANAGGTVFELLARKFDTDDILAQGTQTLGPTQTITGQPPEVGVDRDSQPDAD